MVYEYHSFLDMLLVYLLKINRNFKKSIENIKMLKQKTICSFQLSRGGKSEIMHTLYGLKKADD